MFEPASHDRIAVQFGGAEAGQGPLTWGQKAIWQDMQESGSQFSMGGWLELPDGSTIGDASAVMSGAMGRHAALRMRLATDSSGRLGQEIAGSGQASLEILTLPDDCDPAYAAQYAAELMDSWPFSRFDFERDWPLRMAVIRLRGACLHMVWVLSHLAADGGGNVLLLEDLLADETARLGRQRAAPEAPGRCEERTDAAAAAAQRPGDALLGVSAPAGARADLRRDRARAPARPSGIAILAGHVLLARSPPSDARDRQAHRDRRLTGHARGDRDRARALGRGAPADGQGRGEQPVQARIRRPHRPRLAERGAHDRCRGHNGRRRRRADSERIPVRWHACLL